MYATIKNFLWQLFHTLFRYFNFPHELGLIAIGSPDADSPVFVSGNYTLTVKRLEQKLDKFDCYLLVANSRGSNVWCAAGMNEFTDHDVVDAVNVAQLSKKLNHRRLILPVYAATGIDCDAVRDKTGFHVKWGPTHLDDLPEFINNDLKRTPAMFEARFGFPDRIEQALSTSWSYLLTVLLGVLIWPVFMTKVVALTFALYLLVYGLFPLLPEEKRWARTILITVISSAAMLTAGILGAWSAAEILLWMVVLLVIILLLVTDLCGSTPLYKSTIKHWLKQGDYHSDFSPVIDPALCVNCIQCILVCPKKVFAAVRGKDKTVVAVHPELCEECLACVKQCPTDAIFSRIGKTKGDVKSIENLDYLVSRDCSHLKIEDRWIGKETCLRKSIPVVVE